MCNRCSSLEKRLSWWQEVALIDGADVTALARKEGIEVKTGKEPEFKRFLRDFYTKAEYDLEV